MLPQGWRSAPREAVSRERSATASVLAFQRQLRWLGRAPAELPILMPRDGKRPSVQQTLSVSRHRGSVKRRPGNASVSATLTTRKLPVQRLPGCRADLRPGTCFTERYRPKMAGLLVGMGAILIFLTFLVAFTAYGEIAAALGAACIAVGAWRLGRPRRTGTTTATRGEGPRQLSARAIGTKRPHAATRSRDARQVLTGDLAPRPLTRWPARPWISLLDLDVASRCSMRGVGRFPWCASGSWPSSSG